MKTTLPLVLIFSMLSLVSMAQTTGEMPAEEPKKSPFPRRAVLRFSPFHFFDNSVQMSLEGFLDKSFKRSIVLAPILYYADNDRRKENGFAAELQYRSYVLGFKPYKLGASIRRARGFYFAAAVAAGQSTITTYEQDYSIFPNPFPRYQENVKLDCRWITPSVLLGFQFTIWEVIYVDLAIGGGLKINEVVPSYLNNNGSTYYEEPNVFSRDYKGFMPRVNLSIGVGL